MEIVLIILILIEIIVTGLALIGYIVLLRKESTLEEIIQKYNENATLLQTSFINLGQSLSTNDDKMTDLHSKQIVIDTQQEIILNLLQLYGDALNIRAPRIFESLKKTQEGENP